MDTTRIDLPSCSFHLRQTRGKDKTIDGAIYIRYFVCGKYVERSTNIHIPVTHWDKTNQLVTSSNKNYKRLNAELVSIKEKFDKQILSVSGHITPLIVQQIFLVNTFQRITYSREPISSNTVWTTINNGTI